MDLPIEVINAVKPASTLKARKPYVKKLTKRILQAIGSGLRTSTSIANLLGLPKQKIQSNLHHIKAKGLVYSSKQEGKLEHKYHLSTENPVVKAVRKPKKMVIKRTDIIKAKVINEVNNELSAEQAKSIVQMQQRLNALELTLVEKEKEVWTLECEVFDKKAIIKYLEEKLFVLGVR
jgi:hypothetical protein